MLEIDKKNHEVEKLFNDLNKPSLHALSYALRHPDTWPEDFVWDYSQCQSCAMGLAHRLWYEIPKTTPATGASHMARVFAMPFGVAKSIFLGSFDWVPSKIKHKTEGMLWWKETITTKKFHFEDVTPEMVADQIDKYLETVK